VTYSIVARDSATGQLGVAAQSCAFALGSVLPWARAGIGAVATQARADPGYGPRGLDLLAAGVEPAAALEQLRSSDEHHQERQVGLVNAAGTTASFTGADCLPETCSAAGDGFTAQANLMLSPGVCDAMALAYETATGALATRLVAALNAAQRAGGDARGQMSAALLVVDGTRCEHPWEGVIVDVRVDHHPAPLDELERLVHLAQSRQYDERALELLESGDPAAALDALDAGLALAPGDADLVLTRAAALVALGRDEEARSIIVEIVDVEAGWADALRAFSRRGLLGPIDPSTLERLLP
jgi:uncharacterized Ntn-hydrolase superfamily protein